MDENGAAAEPQSIRGIHELELLSEWADRSSENFAAYQTWLCYSARGKISRQRLLKHLGGIANKTLSRRLRRVENFLAVSK